MRGVEGEARGLGIPDSALVGFYIVALFELWLFFLLFF